MDQPSIVRKLVLGGASTYIVDRFGNTALHLACEINSLECIKALLDPINNYEYANNILQYKPKIDFPYAYIDEYNYSGKFIIIFFVNVILISLYFIYASTTKILEWLLCNQLQSVSFSNTD